MTEAMHRRTTPCEAERNSQERAYLPTGHVSGLREAKLEIGNAIEFHNTMEAT